MSHLLVNKVMVTLVTGMWLWVSSPVWTALRVSYNFINAVSDVSCVLWFICLSANVYIMAVKWCYEICSVIYYHVFILFKAKSSLWERIMNRVVFHCVLFVDWFLLWGLSHGVRLFVGGRKKTGFFWVVF